ncbi:AMP-binding protein [Paenibacillus sp. FSL H7-0756]|uniref:class I adenylate-forming enzyme family protein n=1 Tax=Paenibacillus sp. FSL H7-0756 TaxID=2954738 RepID=UPI0030F8976F
MNLAELILERAQQVPHRIAISDGLEELTYAELTERVRRVAGGLRHGGHTEQPIAILSGNRIEFAEFLLGAIYAGCAPVLLDPMWPQAVLEQVIHQCEPGMIISEAQYAAKLAGSSFCGMARLVFDNGQSTGSYREWLSGCGSEASAERHPELLFIGYTSGTTGVPKGYMRTHQSWFNSFRATEQAFGLHQMQHVLAPGPFVHSLSLFALLQSLYSLATFHLLAEFDAARVLEFCSCHPEVILFVVPAMADAMLHHADKTAAKVTMQAIISSGGKWPAASAQRCRERFKGAKLYEYYGSSEASYISYQELTGAEPPDSLGRPFSGVELSTRDGQFREVPPGTVGELYVRSGMMFAGYYGLPEETAQVFRDGWLRTGDYAAMDEEGQLRLAGRAGSMIKSGGLKVFPEEVEAVLLRHPAVREVMVCGFPDDRWGEQVTALIAWSGPQRLALEDIRSYCRPFLDSYKLPGRLISVKEFIYTGSGKIARQLMKSRAEAGMK